MANLLPQNNQRALRSEQMRRFGVVALAGLAGTVIANAVFLFPSFLITRERANALERDFALASQHLEKQKASDAGTALKRLGESVATLLSVNAVSSPTEALRTVSLAAAREPGVSLSSFTFATNAGGASTLSIRGVSATRETLLSFADLLEETGAFADVSVPISMLADKSDIDFILTLPLKASEV